MAHIIAEPCIGTKDTACVEVCPVECIPKDEDNEETEEQLWEKYRRLTEAAAV